MTEPERQFENCRDVHPAQMLYILENSGAIMLSDTPNTANGTAEYFIFTY
jgi:hypothetical protein